MEVTHGVPGQALTPSLQPDRRRSRRVKQRLPLMVESGRQLARVVTDEISRHGAGLSSRFEARPGDVLLVANLDLVRAAAVRVIRCDELTGGYRRLGVEILDPGVDLWGDAYES